MAHASCLLKTCLKYIYVIFELIVSSYGVYSNQTVSLTGEMNSVVLLDKMTKRVHVWILMVIYVFSNF